MTPFQAACRFAMLSALATGRAIAFAHHYEATASEADFDLYLDFIHGTRR